MLVEADGRSRFVVNWRHHVTISFSTIDRHIDKANQQECKIFEYSYKPAILKQVSNYICMQMTLQNALKGKYVSA